MKDHSVERARGNPRLTAAILLSCTMLLAGCVHNPPRVYGEPGTAPSPDKPWTPPERIVHAAKAAKTSTGTIPEDLLEKSKDLTLLDIVDIALRNSPQTAAAWSQARSAAAAYGSQKGNYYPQLDASASVTRTQGNFANGQISYYQRSYQPSADLTWLLYDFGGRKAAVSEKRDALIAADFSHNAMIQNVVLTVEQAYYQYLTAKALYQSQESALKEAHTNLSAAQDRHKAGLATIADVLQARTALAQAQLQMDSFEGQIQTTRGALATAMGLPANVPYDVGQPSGQPEVENTLGEVDNYLDKALENRPDLAAAKANALKASAHVSKIRAEAYPSLTGSATVGRTYYDSHDLYGNSYTAGIYLKVPLFTGFSHQYDVLQARADEDTARSQFQSKEQEVTYQVWSSYYALRTAKQRVITSRDLLKSATESQEVALGRYKAGVGSILDLLAAQSALQNARAQRVQADSDWYMAKAQLAHDTGTLTIADRKKELGAPVTVEKEKKP